VKIGDFLKSNFLSVGDNVKFLLEKLNIHSEELLKKLESIYGEPAKMSKSKANTVDPEEVIDKYGADTIRLYILFAGPVEKDFEWTQEGVTGAFRFLKRFWSFSQQNLESIRSAPHVDKEKVSPQAKELRRKVYQTLEKYEKDMQNLSFNTAIAGIMELFNSMQDYEPSSQQDWSVLKEAFHVMLFMLYPITPHICEELWEMLGNEKPMIYYPFPTVDREALEVEEVEIPVQVNGKLRSTIKIRLDSPEDEVKNKAIENPKVQPYISGKQIKKVIYVKNKLINLVVG